MKLENDASRRRFGQPDDARAVHTKAMSFRRTGGIGRARDAGVVHFACTGYPSSSHGDEADQRRSLRTAKTAHGRLAGEGRDCSGAELSTSRVPGDQRDRAVGGGEKNPRRASHQCVRVHRKRAQRPAGEGAGEPDRRASARRRGDDELGRTRRGGVCLGAATGQRDRAEHKQKSAVALWHAARITGLLVGDAFRPNAPAAFRRLSTARSVRAARVCARSPGGRRRRLSARSRSPR